MDKGHGTSEYVVWMCFGSMSLSLGAVEKNKMRKNKKETRRAVHFAKKKFFLKKLEFVTF